MNEVIGSLTDIIEALEKRKETAGNIAESRNRMIRRKEYGPDTDWTKQELMEKRGYHHGERWAYTATLNMLRSLNPEAQAHLNKVRIQPGTCMFCGEPHGELPDYCGGNSECLNENEYIVKDAHGNEWRTCGQHLSITLTAVGEATVFPIKPAIMIEERDEETT